MKLCPSCNCVKPLSQFHRRADRPSGAVPRCKTCKAERAREYRARNPDSVKKRSLVWHHQNRDRSIANTVRWQKENADRHKARAAQWRTENRDRVSENFRQWAAANRAQIAAIKGRRRAAELRAVVGWSDPDVIATVYEQARATTLETGVPHNVDHIVPLQSKFVCGLHVHQNLRVLPKLQNTSKGNRWWPDMPEVLK